MRLKRFLYTYRRSFIFLAHLLIFIIAFLFAFVLRFDFSFPLEYKWLIVKILAILAIIKTLIFYYFGVFSGLWRYVNIDDVWRITKASFISSVVFVIVAFFIGINYYLPYSVFVLDWILCTGLVTGMRFATRMFRERFRPTPNIFMKRVLIMGAGEAGVMVLREVKHNQELGMRVIGFIDDDPNKKRQYIQGFKILGTRNDIASIVKEKSINEVIIAMPSASGESIRDIISRCQLPNLTVKIVPKLNKILGGELEIRPREVKPDDLLGRETVNIDKLEIRKYLKEKRVLITGAAGSIGSELCRKVANFSPEEIILIDHNENNLYFLIIELKSKYPSLNIQSVIGDINDIGLLKETFSKYKPQVVFHAAAYKHVPLMEDNPIAAVKNNAIGSRNIIYAAHHYRVERFVLISTDKAVNPVNIMGLSKRLAEIFLQAKAKRSKTKFMAVRFGNVLGSDGSVVPLFKKQIEAGGPITITHPDATRYFMSIREAALLVLQAGAIGAGGEIFILDMGDQIKIVDLAKDLVTLSGLELGKNIFIKYVGLRPGEKIREELLLDKDKDKITKHNKIYINQPDDFDLVSLRKQLKELESYINSTNKDKVIRKMKEIVFSAKGN
ncbi:MAG: nucleoside-diphosphate sugar epimerase/dehydratase [Candidatus Omnitrophica bacterium]|nr:nucleoside-diphosphate sugar epimerase/dehydratase [Candidatus Omnitrophota bacterium]